MPRSSNPARYPTEMAQAVSRAISDGEFRIPSPPNADGRPTASWLRAYFQSYIKAVETAGTLPEISDLMVRLSGNEVILCRRSNHPVAQTIAAALGSSVDDAEARFLESIK